MGQKKGQKRLEDYICMQAIQTKLEDYIIEKNEKKTH